MFACHTIQNGSRGTSAHPSYASRAQDSYASHHTQHSYDVSPSSYTLPPVNAPSPSYGHFVGSLPSYSSSPWSGHADSSSFLNYNRWPQSSSPTNTLSSLSPCSLRETSYGTQASGRPSETSNYGDTRGPQHGYQPTPSPDLDYADRHRPDNIGSSISSSADVVPPPRHRVSPGSAREPASGRNSNRPVGILRCTSCKVTSSPEWRKGPSGKKELCNAFVIFHIFFVVNCPLTCVVAQLWSPLCSLSCEKGGTRGDHSTPKEGKGERDRGQGRGQPKSILADCDCWFWNEGWRL